MTRLVSLPIRYFELLAKCEVKVAGYWPCSFFCVFMDQDGVKVHNLVKKEQGWYSAILTKQAWPLKDLLIYGFQGDFSCGIQQAVPSGQDSSILPTHVANHSAGFGLFLPAHRASQIIIRSVIFPTALVVAVDIFMYYFSFTASDMQQ